MTKDVKDRLIEFIRDNPKTPYREIARIWNCSHSTITNLAIAAGIQRLPKIQVPEGLA